MMIAHVLSLFLLFVSVEYLSSVLAQTDPRQISALKSLYETLNGDAWAWEVFSVDPWDFETDPCGEPQWYGVSCSFNATTKFHEVTSLNLSYFNVRGSFSSVDFRNLSSIVRLEFHSNILTGPLPELTYLDSLQYLDLTSNYLNGPMRSEMKFPPLKFLLLGDNYFIGTVPNWHLPELITLDLWYNFLKGKIPDFLHLPNLQNLYLHDNGLSGPIPDFTSLPYLQTLALGRNELIGTIPNFSNILTLRKLDLGGWNSLHGPITNLNSLQFLEYLDLGWNYFGGTLTDLSLPCLQTLFLGANSFSGTVPELSILANLSTLDLGSNSLMGKLVGFNVSLLTYLDLGYNRLTGLHLRSSTGIEYLNLGWNSFSVMPNISEMKNLTELYFGSNHFTGKVPDLSTQRKLLRILDLGCNTFTDSLWWLDSDDGNRESNFENLRYLWFGRNRLTGSLMDFKGVPSLLKLDLGTNKLSGPLMDFSSLPLLTVLNFGDNDFTGTIPNFSNIPKLQELSISYCKVSGTIPTFNHIHSLISLSIKSTNINGTIPNFSQLPNLLYLELDSNLLSGTIPNFNQLTHLEVLDVSNNFLRGTLPDFSSLKELYEIKVSQNHLSGTIPNLNQLTHMKYFDLHNNFLRGTIPDFSSLKELYEIDMSQNHLSGTIPESLVASHPFIFFVNLSLNNLSGIIPDIKNEHLDMLDLSFNRLSGTIPESQAVYTLGLYLQFNNLSGTIPNIQNFPILTVLWIQHNKLTGTIPHFKSMQDLDLSLNTLSGSIPNWELPSLYFVTLSGNMLSGSIPSFGNASSLQLLYLDHNRLEGTIPPWTHLKYLTNLRLQSNQLHGSIPSLPSSLTYLDLSNNNLGGTLPPTLPPLFTLDISNNHFSGSFPRSLTIALANIIALNVASNKLEGRVPLYYMHNITTLNLKGNRFSGRFDEILSPINYQSLSFIDVSDNKFTGTIPDWYFNSQSLRVFAASKNCFSGSLPEAICDASSLTTLALDGLGTAEKCQEQIFPKTEIHTYRLRKPMTGSIHDCIFRLPHLQMLHLSGNGFTGSIPSGISKNLSNLVVSHNRLKGEIPDELFHRDWKVLDISINRITGTLQSSFENPDSVRLNLAQNRLSGLIPSTFFESTTLNLLEGNLFDCIIENGHSHLPAHDPSKDSYTCGSRSVDTSLIAWACIGCWIVIFRVIVLLLESLQSKNKQTPLKNIKPPSQYLSQSYIEMKDELKGYYDLLLKWWNKLSEIDDQMVDSILPYSEKFRIKEMKSCRKGFRYITLLALFATATIVLVYIPTFLGLANYRTHKFSYTWAVSMAFLSGKVPAIALLLITLFLFFAPNFAILKYFDYSHDIRFASLKMQKSVLFSENTWKSFFTRCSIITTNNVIMLALNIFYVYFMNQGLHTRERIGLQLGIAIMKTLWSVAFLKRIFLFILKVIDGKDNDPTGRVQLLSLLNIFNFVVAPLISLVAFDSNCFKNTLFSQSQISVSYNSVPTCSASLNGTYTFCYTTFSEVKYSPPFIYQYQCTSTLLSDFMTIFIYKYTISIFLIMVGSISLLLLVKYRFNSDIITAIFLPKQINFTILKLKKQNLIWCPLAEQEKWLLQYIGFLIQDDDTSNKCFDDDILVIGLIADFAVLFTFGVAFPPLAVIVCVSILYQVVFHQVLIGRLLCELEESIIDEEEELAEKSRSLRYTEVLTDKWMVPEIYMGYLADECNSLWAHFKASIKYLAFFSSAFLSFFFFDILGDDLGLDQSIWIIPVTICIPFYIMLGQQFFEYLSASWKCQGQKPASTQVVPQCIEDDLSSDHNLFRVQDESQVDDQITKEFEH